MIDNEHITYCWQIECESLLKLVYVIGNSEYVGLFDYVQPSLSQSCFRGGSTDSFPLVQALIDGLYWPNVRS